MANANIRLTPEDLLAQSTQLSAAQSSFEGLFSALNNVLTSLNGEWSAAISRNFVAKIQSAQKACSGIVEMFGNGSNAAKLSAMLFSEDSNTVDSILGSLMNYAESETFKSIDDVVKDIMTGEDASLLRQVLGKNYDTETVKSIMLDIKNKNYDGIMQTVYEKGKDIFGDYMSSGFDQGWVGVVNECLGEVGIKSPFTDLGSEFAKHQFFDSVEKAAEVGIDLSEHNYQEAFYDGCEMAWNMTGGAVLNTAGDAAYKAVSSIPILGDYYKDNGAHDAASMFEVAGKDLNKIFTGDTGIFNMYKDYYSEHGGAVRGIVDGLSDISSFINDKGTEFIQNFAHSIVS